MGRGECRGLEVVLGTSGEEILVSLGKRLRVGGEKR